MSEIFSEREAIDLKDYKVVSAQLFRFDKAPFMNIYPKKISFSNEARGMLNNCQAIRIMINEQKKTIAIRAMPPSESNTLVWAKEGIKGTYIPQYLCPKLTGHLYSIWGWDVNRRYKASGVLVQFSGRPLIVFDFSSADSFPTKWEELVNDRK